VSEVALGLQLNGEASRCDMRVISLGAGVQSTAMYLMAASGELVPRPDVAVFADTQSEGVYTYEHLDWLDKNFGSVIPIRRLSIGSLYDRVLDGASAGAFSPVPFWVESGNGRSSPGRRQCTREYKVDVVKLAIRQELGLARGQHASGKYRVEEWIGISLDEAHRAKPSKYTWIDTRWPLLHDRPTRRGGCIDWLSERGYPIPKNSACVFCPWLSDAQWRDMRDNHPAEFSKAVAIDTAVSACTPMQRVHRSMLPLPEAIAGPSSSDSEQMSLFGNECEGMCGL